MSILLIFTFQKRAESRLKKLFHCMKTGQKRLLITQEDFITEVFYNADFSVKIAETAGTFKTYN